MCPSCIANVAVMVFGLTSTGGVTAFLWWQSTSDKADQELEDENSGDQKEKN